MYESVISPQYKAEPAESLMKFLCHQTEQFHLTHCKFYGKGRQLHQMNDH